LKDGLAFLLGLIEGDLLGLMLGLGLMNLLGDLKDGLLLGLMLGEGDSWVGCFLDGIGLFFEL